MGSCVSILVRVCPITERVSLRNIEEHDKLAAEDKTRLIGLSWEQK